MEKIRKSKGAVGCQPSEWIVAGTEQRDKTRGRGGGVDPITVETNGNPG